MNENDIFTVYARAERVCPGCGHRNEVEAALIVGSDYLEEFRRDIKSGAFFYAHCSNCGSILDKDLPCLVFDSSANSPLTFLPRLRSDNNEDSDAASYLLGRLNEQLDENTKSISTTEPSVLPYRDLISREPMGADLVKSIVEAAVAEIEDGNVPAIKDELIEEAASAHLAWVADIYEVMPHVLPLVDAKDEQEWRVRLAFFPELLESSDHDFYLDRLIKDAYRKHDLEEAAKVERCLTRVRETRRLAASDFIKATLGPGALSIYETYGRKCLRGWIKLSSNHPDLVDAVGRLPLVCAQQFSEEQGYQDALENMEALLDIDEITKNQWAIEVVLHNIGILSANAFMRIGDLGLLKKAIASYETLLRYADPHAGIWGEIVANSAAIYGFRFQRTHDIADSDRSIELYKDALDLVHEQSPEYAGRLSNLALALLDRYEADENSSEHLASAISYLQLAIDNSTTGDEAWVRSKVRLSLAYSHEFADSGDLEKCMAAFHSIKDTIAFATAFPEIVPSGVISAGNALRNGARRNRSIQAYDCTLELYRLALTPDSNYSQWIQDEVAHGVASMAEAYLERYELSGHASDLDSVLEIAELALSNAPNAGDVRGRALNTLAIALHGQYIRSGQIEDLNSSVTALREAIACAVPIDSPAAAQYHSNLSVSLLERFRRTAQLEDLQSAIDAIEEAVDRTPPDADELPRYLNNHGNSLRSRYLLTGRYADLDAAVNAWQRAVELTPLESPDLGVRLYNLGSGFRDQYAQTKRAEDLQSAVDAYQLAVDHTPKTSPAYASRLHNLSNILREQHAKTGQFDDMEASISGFRKACRLALRTSPEVTLLGAQSWGHWAFERRAWEEATEAYDYGEKALQRLLEAQLLRGSKEIWLRDVHGLAAHAAYAFAQTGDLVRAVEFIEGGRARLLAEELERNRHDLEQLPKRGHEELLARYREAADRLAALSTDSERRSEAPFSGIADARKELSEARSELDDTIQAVRQVLGYENFLKSPTFAQIQAAAKDAPLVYLIYTTVGGLALVVTTASPDSDTLSSSGVRAVWLDTLSVEAVTQQLFEKTSTRKLNGYLGAYFDWRDEPYNIEHRTRWFNAVEQTTNWLWRTIVGPLRTALAPTSETGDEEPSDSPTTEVVIIPTGLLGLLPLHAAWAEDAVAPNGRRYALDRATFRYAPNARAILAAQAITDQPVTERLLLCVEPEPVSANPLPAAEKEALDIRKYWPQESYTSRWRGAVTHDELLSKLPEHTCLHFSGHAFADWAEPREGGLLTASDQVVNIGELTGVRAPLRLAILSACETGLPGIQLPDEVIGLPTALMEAGVIGVVASLWAVADESTAQLMAHFHRLWRQEGLSPPEALRRAQIQLREEGYAHPYYWGAFAYTGV